MSETVKLHHLDNGINETSPSISDKSKTVFNCPHGTESQENKFIINKRRINFPIKQSILSYIV
jgi:hypothetical protein